MASMIVRNPTPGEVETAADVAFAAFGNKTREHWQKSFADVAGMFGERFILIVEMDGRIVSTLLCCPAPIVIDGVEVTHSSVGAVATLSEYRKQGCAGVMMIECVKLLRREGICTSSLWPFSYPYYRKFGWEVGGEARKYRGEGSVFIETGDASRARAATPNDYKAILDLYDSHALAHNCCTRRSPEWWTNICHIPNDLRIVHNDDHRAVICLDGQSTVVGYTIYSISADETKRWAEVKEIVSFEPGDRPNMLALVASTEPDLEIRFAAPAEDLYLHEIPDPRAVSVKVEPSFQFRVTDPEGAMASLQPHEHVDCSFTLSIGDAVFMPGFEFSVNAADGEITIGKPGRSNRIEMTVQTLAKLMTGYINILDAWRLGAVRAGEAAIIEASQVFPSLSPYRSWLEPG